MGDTEEYLDDLLHSLSDESDAEQEQFLKQFEEELSQNDVDDDFLKQLDEATDVQNIEDLSLAEKTETVQPEEMPNPMTNEEQLKQEEQVAESENPEPDSGEDMKDGSQDEDLMALLSNLAEDPELNSVSEEDSQPETEKDVAPKAEENETVPEQAETSEQIEEDSFGLSGMDIFGDEDTGDLDSLNEETSEEETSGEEEAEETKTKGKKKKDGKEKKEKNGFLQKLSLTLFGEDDEEEFQTEEEKALQAIEADKEKELKEKKKQEKAEAKAKKKEEKAKKKAEKKANKPKKEKKPKVPKEKDNTPPLPKKPIILMAVMGISILALVMLGSNAVGYTVARSEAKSAYKSGDYVLAYAKLAGCDIREKDEEFFTQAGLLATLQEEYNAYQTMMSLGENEMALDCLVRGIGRYDRNFDDATKYGIAPEYNALEQQMAAELSNTFGIDEEKAREIYGQRSRKKYTIEIKKVLMSLGME